MTDEPSKPRFGKPKPRFGSRKSSDSTKRKSVFPIPPVKKKHRSNPVESSNKDPPKKKKFKRKPSFGKKAKSADIEDVIPKLKRFGSKGKRFGRSVLRNVPNNQSQEDLRKAMKRKKELRMAKYGRLLVLEVHQEDFQTKIRAFDERKEREYTIYLHHEWRTDLLDSGDTIHVIPAPVESVLHITRDEGMIVMHPDVFVSPSRISGAFDCMRKQIITKKHRSGEKTESLLKGTMVHDLFELSLNRHHFDKNLVEKDIDLIVRYNIQNLYFVGMSENVARSHLQGFLSNMESWFLIYQQMQTYDSNNMLEFPRQGKLHVHVDSVLETEQSFWSLKFGMMGHADGTLRVTYGANSDNYQTQVMPFELKTGRDNSYSQMSAQAQVSLYRMMIKDYLEEEVSAGMLYFMQSNNMSAVALGDVELVNLIQQRNKLAYYQKTDHEYPELKQEEFSCKRCFQKNTCMIYHRTLEHGTSETSGVPEVFNDATRHLTKTHMQYLSKWTRLIDLEESEAKGGRSEMWAMESDQRERLSRCVSNLKLVNIPPSDNGARRYVFRKYSPRGEKIDLPKGLKFKVGQWLIVSTEDGRYGICKGALEAFDSSSLTIKVRGMINFDILGYDMLYRLDKDELLGSYQTARSNVVSLFLPEVADKKRRELVVDLRAPRFGKMFNPNWMDAFRDEFAKLNKCQQRAVEKVFRARDYTLILGMPGTGKSTVIVFIVRVLAHFGKRVLITAYTNTAVDNLCVKLASYEDFKFIRVGKREKIDTKVVPYIMHAGKCNTVAELRKNIRNTFVFATTTSSAVSNELIISQQFNYCIVDEASQLTEPNALGPLRYCETFVLVGDHYQLPPLVQSAQAREEKMDISLFKRLCSEHPQSKMELDTQYRMSSDILLLCNHLVYNHKLKCGSDAIGNACLELKQKIPMKYNWLANVLRNEQRVLFLNVDKLPSDENENSKQNVNQMEIDVCVLCIETMKRAGLETRDIGVMSPYNSQLTALRESIGIRDVEVDSMDRFQGRDKDCILISFVHRKEEANKKKSIRILNDWKRINVALTRAKKKLIMIGSHRFFQTIPMLQKLSKLLKEQNWIFDVVWNNDIQTKAFPVPKSPSIIE